MARIEPALAGALGDLVQAISRPDFAELLLGFVGTLVANDFTTMTRYSRFSKPDYVIHSKNYSTELVSRYLESYYRFDPFFRLWRETERPGVVALGDLSSKEVKRGRYIREFLAEGGITDQIGIFLPPIGRASVALFLERSTRRFTARERGSLEDAYPLLAGLYRAHVSALFGAAQEAAAPAGNLALPSRRPILVTDSSGRRVFANAAWCETEARESAALEAGLARARESATKPVPIGEDRVLHGEELDQQFSIAPGGRMWVIEQLARPPESDLAAEPQFDELLTRREKQIVDLILQGHPTITIAERLGLSRGTIKNHRRRLYYKLDITSERELFLLQIRRMSQVD